METSAGAEQIQVEDGVTESQGNPAVHSDAQSGEDSAAEGLGQDGSNHSVPRAIQQMQHDTTSHYGNKLPLTKSDESLLFTFLNVNGMPQKSTKHKNQTIRNFINNYNIDVFGMAEVNLHWKSLPTKDRWEERTLGWWEDSRVSTAYNVEDEATQVYQPGGCLQVTTKKLVGCWVENGSDPTGLGRWTWSRYMGKTTSLFES